MTDGLYIGLISGTSADGVDTALVETGPDNKVTPLATLKHNYPPDLQAQLHALVYESTANELQLAMELDHALGGFFAACCLELLDTTEITPGDVIAIGSHGQTLRHYPDGDHPSTLQIGDPTIIAANTGIRVVADFRRADMAAGGQGAPLMPAFHAAVFAQPGTNMAVLNAGGIANISVIEQGVLTCGLDTGPANTLMDQWILRQRGEAFDESGAWAVGGSVDEDLLGTLMADEWFERAAPKSTGQEYFNLDWVARRAPGIDDLDPRDVQATLLALTSRSVTADIRRYLPGVTEIAVCGGGAHNDALMASLAALNPDSRVTTTAEYGIDPDWVEAAGFAWLASRRIAGLPGNAPAVTGAIREVVLGATWPAQVSGEITGEQVSAEAG